MAPVKELAGDQGAARVEVSAVIKRDYLVSIFLLSPFALWAAFLIKRMGGGSEVLYLVIAIAGTVVMLVCGLARIGRILSLVDRGERTTAEVKHVIMGGHRGRIHFTYTYGGQSFEGVQVFRARESIKKIKKGLRVTVVVDPSRPKNAIIPSVFLRTNPFLETKASS